jgi:hypothetical protein
VAFDDNVFINCPFDAGYSSLLRPLLFTVIYLNLKPRIALECADSGEPRIRKITELIGKSKYGIHDLSRIEATKKGEIFRLNMPFELGIDVGCRSFGTRKQKTKRCLILEMERYRYQAALSDLSGSDIAVHKNEPEEVVIEVRRWLVNQCRSKAPGAAKIWGAFMDFMAANYDELTKRGFSKKDIDNLAVPELIECMEEWVRKNVVLDARR